jgi:hypothetical protein
VKRIGKAAEDGCDSNAHAVTLTEVEMGGRLFGKTEDLARSIAGSTRCGREHAGERGQDLDREIQELLGGNEPLVEQGYQAGHLTYFRLRGKVPPRLEELGAQNRHDRQDELGWSRAYERFRRRLILGNENIEVLLLE